MPTNNQSESLILSKFSVGTLFTYDNHIYTVKISGKPRPSSGECKTDLYIKAVDENQQLREFKLSIKKDNYEFIENKPDKQRIIDIFGNDGINLLITAINKIENKFNSLKLIKYQPKDNSFTCTLGWKIEIFKNTKGKLTVDFDLTSEQKKDIMCGTNLSDEKKNSTVNDQVILDSGVANLFLEIPATDATIKKENVQYFVDKFQSFEDVINDPNFKINARFTALNYRSDEDKWDGDRPLAVRVKWYQENRRLKSMIIFDDPFGEHGNTVRINLQNIIKTLGIEKRLSREDLENFISDQSILS